MLYIPSNSHENAFLELIKTLDLEENCSRDDELLIEDQLVFDISNQRANSSDITFTGSDFQMPKPLEAHFDPKILEQVKGHYLRILEKGKRVAWVIGYLQKEQFSKRAIIDFWEIKHSDTSHKCPCVVYFMFRVSKNGLDMSVHMRSNDINRKMLLNLYLFDSIHRFVASSIGEKVGKYYHFVDTVIVHDVDKEKFIKLQKDALNSEDFFGRN